MLSVAFMFKLQDLLNLLMYVAKAQYIPSCVEA
jgi:hypothetical protein